MKEAAVNFWLNVLSVILGIAITFFIQALIDHSRDRKDVRSALELIRAELQATREDIATMASYLEQERQSATYFVDHASDLDRCPEDSVNYHGGILYAEASITMSHDALELLKMSSLFQKIGDNDLSMKIIRAYDSCGSIAATVNRHIEARNARFEATVDGSLSGRKAAAVPDIRDFLRTDTGYFTVLGLATQADADDFTDAADLESAIRAIDTYLHRR